MQGWISLGSFAYGLLDGTRNALKEAPMEYKNNVSSTLIERRDVNRLPYS